MCHVKDKCGVATCLLVWVLSLGTWGGTLALVTNKQVWTFTVVVVLLLVFHLKCVFGDPGRLESSGTLLFEEETCVICNAPKKLRTHHCFSCGVCVLNMDHHCEWINNCVGFYTQKHFILFLFYVVLGCLGSLGMILTELTNNFPEPSNCFVLLFSVLILVFSALFLLASSSMLYDQLSLVVNNTSTIDQLQQRTFEKVTLK